MQTSLSTLCRSTPILSTMAGLRAVARIRIRRDSRLSASRIRRHEGLHVRQDQRRRPVIRALPRRAWLAPGVPELVCTVGFIIPSALRWQPRLTVLAAALLAVESLVFIGVHIRYREIGTIIFSAVLGLLMAFVAYGRLVLRPIA